MERQQRTRWLFVLVGLVFAVAGARIVQNISGAGGNLVPPIIALGVLMVLFGATVVVAALQRRLDLRQFLGYAIVAGSLGLFAISGYVAVLGFGATGELAPLFQALSAIGLLLSLALLIGAYGWYVGSDESSGGD